MAAESLPRSVILSQRYRELRRSLAIAAIGAGALLLSGCAHMPTTTAAGCFAGDPPAAGVTTEGELAFARLDVLTYNIEGLPWPARRDRSAQLREIGAILKTLRESGEGPDVVVFQEAFSRTAAASIDAAGYPAVAAGPSRTQSGAVSSGIDLPGKARPMKGELGIRLLGSGLVIASRYPIVASTSRPYSRRSCAGIDCLSSKGMLLARIAVPGVPYPVDVFNTHMNAQRASRVSRQRHLASHNAQTVEMSHFLLEEWNRDHPVIFGGDFNMRGEPERFGPFEALQPLQLVHHHCMDPANECEVRMSWDGDEPWMDTQDLQLFASSGKVRILPERVEAMFDGSEGSPRLSDHAGFRVIYRLEWNRSLGKASICERDEIQP